MIRMLILADHRLNRSPCQRFRFEQYLAPLEESGFEITISSLIPRSVDRFYYRPGNRIRKAAALASFTARRCRDVLRSRNFDIVFVSRSVHPLGTVVFERAIRMTNAKLVLDFDDSIWLHPRRADGTIVGPNHKYAWMKRPGKIADTIAMSDLVLAGNRYLADYASLYSGNVEIVPTTIDTRMYQRTHAPANNSPLVIGWSGSTTTIPHFEYAISALTEIKRRFSDRVRFKVIGDSEYRNESLGIVGKAWNASCEIDELSEIDIGIMPLRNDEWSKGKCGLKGLQYMALGIPTVMSPVGVNREIIKHGVNGFLAGDNQEWVNSLSHLILNEGDRKRLGRLGRQTVVNSYSVGSQQSRYIGLLKSLLC